MAITNIYGILGEPLGHSLSPVLHNWALQRAGIDGVYCVFERPDWALDGFMQAVRGLPLQGVSVTIPHKRAVGRFPDRLTDRAQRIGATNTLYWEDGQLVGDNTDITGFMSPFEDNPFHTALVLGAGGAARAALAGLIELGVDEVYLANRTGEKAEAVAASFGAAAVPWNDRARHAAAGGAELLVNATPLGMAGERQDMSPWPDERFDGVKTAYDLVYNPLPTRFLREAKAAHCVTVDGLDMFLGQAAEQFRLWTGQDMDLAAGRELLLKHL